MRRTFWVVGIAGHGSCDLTTSYCGYTLYSNAVKQVEKDHAAKMTYIKAFEITLMDVDQVALKQAEALR